MGSLCGQGSVSVPACILRGLPVGTRCVAVLRLTPQHCGCGAATDLVTSVDVYNQTSLFLYTGDMSGSLYLRQ